VAALYAIADDLSQHAEDLRLVADGLVRADQIAAELDEIL